MFINPVTEALPMHWGVCFLATQLIINRCNDVDQYQLRRVSSLSASKIRVLEFTVKANFSKGTKYIADDYGLMLKTKHPDTEKKLKAKH